MSKYEDFNGYRKELRNHIVKRIQSVPNFQFLTAPTHTFGTYEGPRSCLQKDLSGKRLLSIDLVKGNFQSLKYLGNQYVLDTETYDDFIRKFTDLEALIRSKYFRQMIFGFLNPELQKQVQQMMLAHIINTIKASGKDPPIAQLTSDEVVFIIESDADRIAIKSAIRNLPYKYRIEEFRICWIPNKYNEPWYVRYNEKGERIRIMSVHVRYLFQVYNYLEGMENQRKDFWWRERNRLCQLLEPEVFPLPLDQLTGGKDQAVIKKTK